jgi:sulfur-oxidizing protein SoxY
MALFDLIKRTVRQASCGCAHKVCPSAANVWPNKRSWQIAKLAAASPLCELEISMNPARRLLLRGALPGVTLSLALATGLLQARHAWAWTTPSTPSPMTGNKVIDLLQSLRTAHPVYSNDIRIIAPTIAEDGASVYLELSTTLPNVDGFVIFVERNPQPLNGAFWIAPAVIPEIKTRIRLSQTSNVWVIVRSDNQFFKASKLVTVTRGGCGIGLN